MRTAVSLIAAALVGGAFFGPTPPAPAAPSGDRPYAVGPLPGETRGGLSCAAASCHGGGRPGERFSEHSTWAADLTRNPPVPHDPHANAYRVLFNADSVRIAGLVGGGPAHTNDRCLACHTAPNATDGAVAEGVGCAGCHGPEEKWLTRHYLPEWKALSNRDKAAFGFVPTKNLVARTSTCAGCHVGDATRDVDHDLIAAGHPRLNFEYARFDHSEAYRKHWADPAADRDFEVKEWAIGQLTSLRAALDLLTARATAADAKLVGQSWPEFSEGSCYACHQTVGRDLYPTREIPGGLTRRGSLVPWQPWYTALVDDAALFAALFPGSARPDLTELRTEMEKRSPDPAKVKGIAARAVVGLAATLAAIQAAEDRGSFPAVSPSRLAGLLAAGALTDDGRLRDDDWDAVAQRYLGLAMTYHAAGGDGPATVGWRKPLLDLRAALAFPTAAGGRIDSPRSYHARDAVRPLTDLRTLTTPRTGR